MKLLLFTLLFGVVFSSEGGENAAEGDAAAEDAPQPANEWGTYYRLHNDYSDKLKCFKNVFTQMESDLGGTEKFSSCSYDQVNFERWYVSSGDENVCILSYFCQGDYDRGYEHIKVTQCGSKDTCTGDVWKSKLSDFGITGAGPYPRFATKNEEEHQRLANAVAEQIVAQLKNDAPICLNPKAEDPSVINFGIRQKTENDLSYTKLPVSCDDELGDPTNKMDVEIVEDLKFKQINEGNPQLVVTYEPLKNIDYQKIQDNLKQSGSARTALWSVALVTAAGLINLLL